MSPTAVTIWLLVSPARSSRLAFSLSATTGVHAIGAPANLTASPRRLHEPWVEYQNGRGGRRSGRKPARLFTGTCVAAIMFSVNPTLPFCPRQSCSVHFSFLVLFGFALPNSTQRTHTYTVSEVIDVVPSLISFFVLTASLGSRRHVIHMLTKVKCVILILLAVANASTLVVLGWWSTCMNHVVLRDVDMELT
jgi:hypothetical protein